MVASTLASAERSPLVPQRRPVAGGGDARRSDTESAAPSVLIAEDHADSRDALRALLEAFGYRVFTAGDGHEAVAEARAHHPDLILMDMMMPGMDGMEATRTLRADPDFPRIPIVAVTAMEGSRERVLSAGCDDWVAKPINIRAFLARVPEWLGSTRSEAS